MEYEYIYLSSWHGNSALMCPTCPHAHTMQNQIIQRIKNLDKLQPPKKNIFQECYSKSTYNGAPGLAVKERVPVRQVKSGNIRQNRSAVKIIFPELWN